MKQNTILSLTFALNAYLLSAQTTKETSEDSSFTDKIVAESCDCISDIQINNKEKYFINNEIKECIAKSAMSLQLRRAFSSDLLEKAKKQNDSVVNIEITKGYGNKTYFEIEGLLMQKCEALQIVLNSNDYVQPNSLSDNEDALEWFYKGVELQTQEKYEEAVNAYEKAVKIDSVFAFAYDNLGISYRKLGNYEKALNAYETSLALEPNGLMPLQNIPIVYIYMKQYNKAVEAYQKIQTFYPENPEVPYGIGRIYIFHLNEVELGLDYMCKAYLLYIKENSAYRTDAQTIINQVHQYLKDQDKESVFFDILKKNNIEVKY